MSGGAGRAPAACKKGMGEGGAVAPPAAIANAVRDALAVMGAADTVSMVIRLSLVQLATPDDMRGRVGAVNYLFVNTSYQLGEFESGITAALLGAVPAAVLGGVGTVAVALLWMKLFPTLRKIEQLE